MISLTTSPQRVKDAYYNGFYSMFVAFLTSFRLVALRGVERTEWEIQYIENIQSNEIRVGIKKITSLVKRSVHIEHTNNEDREFARLKFGDDLFDSLRIVHEALSKWPRWSNEVSPCLLCP